MRPFVLRNDAAGFQRIEAEARILTTSELKFGGGAPPYADIWARIRGVAGIVNIPLSMLWDRTLQINLSVRTIDIRTVIWINRGQYASDRPLPFFLPRDRRVSTGSRNH